jgi:hypothetical protein
MMAMIGGKRKTEIRNATPQGFRDVLLAIAWSAGFRRHLTDARTNHQS